MYLSEYSWLANFIIFKLILGFHLMYVMDDMRPHNPTPPIMTVQSHSSHALVNLSKYLIAVKKSVNHFLTKAKNKDLILVYDS